MDNSTHFWGDFSDEFNVPVGETRFIKFTNVTSRVASMNCPAALPVLAHARSKAIFFLFISDTWMALILSASSFR